MTVNEMISSDARISLAIPPTENPDLAAAFREEAELLESLIGVLERQRRGIAASDLSIVDETVHGSQRILLTLGEARKKRRRLLQLNVGSDRIDDSISDGSERLGPAARAAWRHLREVADRLSATLSVNQSVLQEAIRFGEEYVRAVFGGEGSDHAGYTKDARPSAEASGGVLINRKV